MQSASQEAYKRGFGKGFSKSFGIILYREEDGVKRYLVIKRRNSHPYVMLLRGKWTGKGEATALFEQMTCEEQHRLLSHNFDTLWKDMWVGETLESAKIWYAAAKCKFTELSSIMPGLHERNDDSIVVKGLVEFPKGKRNRDEDGLSAALREFQEETRIPSALLSFCERIYKESYRGINNLLYKTEYYLCTLDRDCDLYTQACKEQADKGYPDFVDPLLACSPPCSYMCKTLLRNTLTNESTLFEWKTAQELIPLLQESKARILTSIEATGRRSQREA